MVSSRPQDSCFPEVLRRGVGHLPYTPLPGEQGNVGLAGHRNSFFRPLRQIRPGDMIALRTTQRRISVSSGIDAGWRKGKTAVPAAAVKKRSAIRPRLVMLAFRAGRDGVAPQFGSPRFPQTFVQPRVIQSCERCFVATQTHTTHKEKGQRFRGALAVVRYKCRGLTVR